MTRAPAPPPGSAPPEGPRGSGWRLLTGAVLFLVALTIAVSAFLSLVGVLEGGGYGTPPMRRALVWLGVAGAFFAASIAIVIWDVAMRYETPDRAAAPRNR